jgi:putative FmdB family regulatory protein
MPLYAYACRQCRHQFERRASLAEYDRCPTAACPQCGAAETARVYTPVGTLSGKEPSAATPASRRTGGHSCGPGCRR